jgi:hypothetical protein
MPVNPPEMRITEFALSGISPIGARHLELAQSGFVQNLGIGNDEFLDFGSVNNTDEKVHSETKVILANIDHFNDANEAVFNMRFWASDTTDFSTGTVFFNGIPSGSWLQNYILTDSSGYFISTVLPSGQNVFRQDGNTELTLAASGTDTNATEFIYLSISVDQDVPVDLYGGNAGGFQYRITFDFK